MTDNVVGFTGSTVLPIPVAKVLDGAKKANLTEAIVVGHDEFGNLYFAGTTSTTADVILLLERAKAFLLREIDD